MNRLADLLGWRRRAIDNERALAAARRYGQRWFNRTVALQTELEREQAVTHQLVEMNVRLAKQLEELKAFMRAVVDVPVVDE